MNDKIMIEALLLLVNEKVNKLNEYTEGYEEDGYSIHEYIHDLEGRLDNAESERDELLKICLANAHENEVIRFIREGELSDISSDELIRAVQYEAQYGKRHTASIIVKPFVDLTGSSKSTLGDLLKSQMEESDKHESFADAFEASLPNKNT